MWYPTDCPILESVFATHEPDADELTHPRRTVIALDVI